MLNSMHLTGAGSAKSCFRLDGFTLYLAFLSVLGVALVLAREVTYGAALHYDSIHYIAVARNLLAGEGFLSFGGYIYAAWPPLYPLLLAVLGFGVLDPLEVAGPLNAAIFGLTVVVVGQYLRRSVESLFVAAWASTAVAISVPLTEWSSWILSEPAFILLATLALICTDKFLTEGKARSLLWAAAFSSLAWQVRYIGVALPILIGLLLLLQRGPSLLQRGRRVAVLSLITTLPMVVWLLRNYLTFGDLNTHGASTEHTLLTLLPDVFGTLRNWMSFDIPPLGRWTPLDFLVNGAALGLLAVATLLLVMFGPASVGMHDRERRQFEWRPLFTFGGFALTYLVLLLVAAMSVEIAPSVRPRYLTPVYIPLLLVFAFMLDRLLIYERRKRLLGGLGGLPVVGRFTGTPSLLTAVLMMALALWTGGQAIKNIQQIVGANLGESNRGYAAPPWAGSETLRYVRENSLAGTVYSNLPMVVHFNNDDPIITRMLPNRRVGKKNRSSKAGRNWSWAWLQDGGYIVWFKNSWINRLYDYGAAGMRVSQGLELVADLADGVIFKVNKGYAPPSNPYRKVYESIVSGSIGPPMHRSAFDVYLDGTALTYFRNPCSAEDTNAIFFLHFIPADLQKLPTHRRRHGFDNLDFSFLDYGLILDGKCLAIVPLPDNEFALIRTGQYTEGGQTWNAEIVAGRQRRGFRQAE